MRKLVPLFLALIQVGSVCAQSMKTHKVCALTKSLANPYFLLMKQGYEYAQKKLGVEVIFGSTPAEEADVEQLNILQSWLTEGSLEGLIVTPFRATSLNSALARVSRKNIPIISIDESSRKKKRMRMASRSSPGSLPTT
jgi:D-allose transport system substrate-binding protein